MQKFTFWRCFAVACLVCAVYVATGSQKSETLPSFESTAYAAQASTTVGWEHVRSSGQGSFYRAKVPGGWLLKMEMQQSVDISFYPDKSHFWNPRLYR